jgi:tripartite-type tricarboxylate transporter receptor subunit TctC
MICKGSASKFNLIVNFNCKKEGNIMIHQKKLTLGLILFLSLTLAGGIWGTPASAADKYPSKPVVITVPFGPSGTTGLSVTLLTPFLTEALGQRVVAVNKAGAGGRIGATEVYRTEPDGYTLLAHNLPTIILGQLVFNAKYDVRKFTQIYGWVKEPRVVAVHKDSPYKTFADLIKASKEKELSASVVGFGVTDHVQSVQLKKIGLNHRIIPFGSGGKAVNALLGKNVDFTLPAAMSAKPHVDDGRIRVLAVTSAEPFSEFPGVPTLKSLGYENLVLYTTRGLMGPPGMDPKIVKILADAMDKAVNSSKFLEEAKKTGEPVEPMKTEEWKKVIDESFVEVEKIAADMKADMAKKK